MKSNIGQSCRKGGKRTAVGMAARRGGGIEAVRRWVFDRQPALSLDEEPVVHGSGGHKLRLGGKEAEL